MNAKDFGRRPVAKDFRKSAWQSLKGKWLVCVIAYIIFDAILAGLSALTYFGVGAVGLIILTGPLTLGWSKLTLRVARGEEAEISTLFSGFSDFGRSLVLYITNYIFIFLWSLLLIIPGIIKQYAYSMSYYILLDNPDMSANEARKKSIEMMYGNKWRLFCLDFSYIGWSLLSIITFGILMLWVAPYHEVARAKFYLSLLPEEERLDSSVSGDTVDLSGYDNGDDAFAGDDRRDDYGKNDFDFSSSDELDFQ